MSLVFSSISIAFTDSNHITGPHLHLLNETNQILQIPKTETLFSCFQKYLSAFFTVGLSFWTPVTGSCAALHLNMVCKGSDQV